MTLFEDLSSERLEQMLLASEEITECYRVLRKVDANVVGDILKDQGTFYELDHYPNGDVFDDETHSQYYYHAHRPEQGEHGHFHTFLRAEGLPPGVEPAPYDGEVERPMGDDAISHLIAIAMDKRGYPLRLFTTNRWVTGETYYPADHVERMLEHFNIDHAYPSWPTNRWITAMVALFRPQIEVLLRKRDVTIEKWALEHAGEDVYEDRDLEVTSIQSVSVSQQIKQVQRALKGRQS